MRWVTVTFDKPQSLTVRLTDEEYEAAMDEYSWDDFYAIMEDTLMEHLFANTCIDDIKVIDG